MEEKLQQLVALQVIVMCGGDTEPLMHRLGTDVSGMVTQELVVVDYITDISVFADYRRFPQ